MYSFIYKLSFKYNISFVIFKWKCLVQNELNNELFNIPASQYKYAIFQQINDYSS